MTQSVVFKKRQIPSFPPTTGACSQFQFHIFSIIYLAVLTGHGEQGDRAVGVAAVAHGGHAAVPEDGHGGQWLARGVRVRHAVALAGRRGQLGAQRQVLLDLLTLALVEVELGVLQVALYLREKSRKQ